MDLRMGQTKAPVIKAPDLLHDPRYLAAVTKSCERLDRILTGSQTITVQVDPNPHQFPAYQSGDRLFIVPANIQTMVTDAYDESEVLPLLVALDLHEMGHHMFSMRPDNTVFQSAAMEWARSENQKRGQTSVVEGLGPVYWNQRMADVLPWLNGVEDQRQEMMLTTLYPRARDYFRLSTLHMLFSVYKQFKGQVPATNYLLYYGRRHFMPAPLLARLRAQLAAQTSEADVQKAETLISEYVTIPATTDANLRRMWDIASDLFDMFHNSAPPATGRSACTSSSQWTGRNGKRMQEKAAKDATKTLTEVDKALEKSAKEKAAKTGTDKATAPQKPQKQTEQSESQSEDEESEDWEDDSEESEESDAQSEGDDSSEDADSGDGDSDGDSLSDMLDDYMDRASGKLASETGARSREIQVELYGTESRKLARLLQAVATDLKETDLSRLRSGKVDVRRLPAAVAEGDPTIFRRRQESLEPEAAMGIHVMVDVSGSMSADIHTALEAAHTIAEAARLAGHYTKVSTFSDTSWTAKDWDQPTLNRSYGTGGGTDPRDLLEGAYKDFQKSGERYRFVNYMVILVTDGEFNDPEGCEKALAAMHRAGVSILLVGIRQNVRRGYYGSGEGYTSDASVMIRTVSDLEKVMRSFVKRAAVRIARRVVRIHS